MIEFKNGSASYDGELAVLNDVSFTVNDGTYVENADKSATLTITIQQQSPDLRYLESCAERKTRGSLALNDANDDGRNIFALNCRVQKLPDRGRGKDAADVPFVFIIPRLELND